MSVKSKELIAIKKETADLVLNKVQTFQNNRELDLPPNYSAANALKSAWLMIQETVDRDKKPALDVCTKESVANALLDMVIQGLNPAKKQVYFIVYGKKLTLSRSYFGTKAVAMRVNKSIGDIFAEVVYSGDTLEYSIDFGKRIIKNHTQQLENIDDSKIVAAYASAIDKDGNVLRAELMTMDQLKMAWKQSKMKPVADNGKIKENSTHGKFTAEMAKKTVTGRLAKHFINTSDDSDLVIQSVQRTDNGAVEAEAIAEIENNANSEVIDITPVDDEQTEQEEEAQVDEPEEQMTGTDGPGF